jgi:hypothetical protein
MTAALILTAGVSKEVVIEDKTVIEQNPSHPSRGWGIVEHRNNKKKSL